MFALFFACKNHAVFGKASNGDNVQEQKDHAMIKNSKEESVTLAADVYKPTARTFLDRSPVSETAPAAGNKITALQREPNCY